MCMFICIYIYTYLYIHTLHTHIWHCLFCLYKSQQCKNRYLKLSANGMVITRSSTLLDILSLVKDDLDESVNVQFVSLLI